MRATAPATPGTAWSTMATAEPSATTDRRALPRKRQGMIAIAIGCLPTGMSLPAVLVAVALGVTVLVS
jgi:hypothetical protein